MLLYSLLRSADLGLWGMRSMAECHVLVMSLAVRVQCKMVQGQQTGQIQNLNSQGSIGSTIWKQTGIVCDVVLSGCCQLLLLLLLAWQEEPADGTKGFGTAPQHLPLQKV